MFERIFYISLVLSGFACLALTSGCRSDTNTQIELAQACEKDGYYQQAEHTYQTITARRPGTPEALAAQRNLVLLYFKMDNYDRAARSLGELIEDYSDQPGLLDTLHEIVAKYRYGSSRSIPGEAVEAWYVQQQIRHDVNRPDVGKGRLAVRAMNALILTEVEPSKAVEVVDKLTADFSEHPDLPRALWFIAEKYKKLKEYEKAAGIYQQIVQRHPDSPYAGKPNVDFQRAHILFLIESERNAEAQAAIDRLGANLRDNTGLLSVLDDIAGKYHSLKKYDDAIEIYNTMIKVDPHSELAAIAQQSIGWIYYSRKMYDRAIQAYRKVLNDYPESVQLAGSQYWIAQSYYRKRQYERAIEEYQKVISAYPESREALHSRRTVAVIYRFLDMDEQAISENRQFLKDYPDSVWAPGAQSRVAESYLTNGKLERAIEEYQKVVEMYPGSQAADSAEKEIIRIRNIIQRKRYLSK